MTRTLAVETISKVGDKVLLKGWVSTRRDHGKIIFIDLRDRSGLIQVICDEQASKLSPQDVVQIIGHIKARPEKLANPRLQTGSVEVQAEKIEVITAAEELPFDMGKEVLDLELPTLLDYRPLTLRHPSVKTIFQVQETIINSFRQAAQKLGCTEVFVPTISASSTEGGAEVFKFPYYDHEAFLVQSPQLYKQMLVPVFERVSMVSHAYRAEPSVTTRHLSEVVQMDCEIGFVEFEELLDMTEEIGSFILETLPGVTLGKIPRLTLREAQEIINSRHEPDLAPQDEVDICKWALEKHKSDLVTITHFPTSKRPFYTMPDPKDPEYSLSYDILFRGLEICSGSQRVNDYQQLVNAIKAKGMDPKDFEMYLQTFKYGMPPEGGFAFGLERLTMKALGLKNIREASLFPRDMERVDIRL